MLAASFFLSAALLVVSGITKLIRPAPAVSALRSAGIDGGMLAAAAVGLIEVAVGVLALWRPDALTAGAVAALYAAFAAFLVHLLRRGEASSCGCIGSREAPASRLHVGLDLVAAVVAGAVAVSPVPSLVTVVTRSPMASIPLLVGLLGGGALLVVAVAEVPKAWGSYRPDHERHSRAAPGPISIGRPR